MKAGLGRMRGAAVAPGSKRPQGRGTAAVNPSDERVGVKGIIIYDLKISIIFT